LNCINEFTLRQKRLEKNVNSHPILLTKRQVNSHWKKITEIKVSCINEFSLPTKKLQKENMNSYPILLTKRQANSH
jgi:hypothetical protein